MKSLISIRSILFSYHYKCEREFSLVLLPLLRLFVAVVVISLAFLCSRFWLWGNFGSVQCSFCCRSCYSWRIIYFLSLLIANTIGISCTCFNVLRLFIYFFFRSFFRHYYLVALCGMLCFCTLLVAVIFTWFVRVYQQNFINSSQMSNILERAERERFYHKYHTWFNNKFFKYPENCPSKWQMALWKCAKNYNVRILFKKKCCPNSAYRRRCLYKLIDKFACQAGNHCSFFLFWLVPPAQNFQIKRNEKVRYFFSVCDGHEQWTMKWTQKKIKRWINRQTIFAVKFLFDWKSQNNLRQLWIAHLQSMRTITQFFPLLYRINGML